MSRKMELLLKFPLPATHCLEEREEPHEHTWRIEVGMTGPLDEGRVVSLPAVRNAFEPAIAELRGTFLNENPHLDPQTRKFPTCECLALHLEKKFNDQLKQNGWNAIKLTQIHIAVEEVDGEETGSARLILD